MLDRRRWKLISPFEYHVGEYPSETVITVPAGFVTDLASVPRILWPIFPPNGKYAKAAIVHDYLYSQGSVSRLYADKVFAEAMKVLRVPSWKIKLMYYAVRLGGRRHYNDQGGKI